MKAKFIIVFLQFCCAVAFGQYYNQTPEFLKANGVWAFETEIGFDFNNGATQFASSAIGRSAVSVADKKTGQLLFYANGLKCWDRSHAVMLNGDGLWGNDYEQQTVQVVRFTGDADKYYLFALGYSPLASGLCLS